MDEKIIKEQNEPVKDVWLNDVSKCTVLSIAASTLIKHIAAGGGICDDIESLLSCLFTGVVPINDVEVLKVIPEKSLLWDYLQKSLEQNALSPILTLTLFNKRPQNLPKEVTRIFRLYYVTYQQQNEESEQSIMEEAFDFSCIHYRGDQVSDEGNYWTTTSLLSLASSDVDIFSFCLESICRLLRKSNYSLLAIRVAHDFICGVVETYHQDLLVLFPLEFHHLLYALYFVVKDDLCKASSSPCTRKKYIAGLGEYTYMTDSLLIYLNDKDSREYLKISLCLFPWSIEALKNNNILNVLFATCSQMG